MKSRLFLKFLLLTVTNSLSVVVLMVVTMQFFVYRNFSDYVIAQELGRLDDLTAAFADTYRQDKSWDRFRNAPRLWHNMLSQYLPAPANQPPPEKIPGIERLANGQRPIHEGAIKRDPFRERVEREGPPPGRIPGMSVLARRISLFDANKNIVFGNSDVSNQAYRKIILDNQVIGWLGLRKERRMMSPTDIAFLKRQSRAFYGIGIIVLIMAIFVSVIFSRHLTAPLKQIAQGTTAIRNRRFDKRISVTSRDELGQLAQDFNAMAQTLHNYERTRQQWITDIAHELRTPLAVLRGEIEALQDGIRQIKPHTLDSLHAEVMYLGKIVDDLGLIAKTESANIEMKQVPVDPVHVLRKTIRRFQQRFADSRMNLQASLLTEGQAWIMGDADRLARVFTNIFENTLRYATSPGSMSVESSVSNNQMEIRISDTGPGVPEDALGRLFDRLYRTDAARNRATGGSGLGLSICKSIIEVHQGTIQAENAASGGLRIVITLPLFRTKS